MNRLQVTIQELRSTARRLYSANKGFSDALDAMDAVAPMSPAEYVRHLEGENATLARRLVVARNRWRSLQKGHPEADDVAGELTAVLEPKPEGT